MSSASPDQITQLLNRAYQGDQAASREVFPHIYEELRKIANARRRKLEPGETLQTTVLVHEAYLRIAGRAGDGWEGRSHFYFVAARAMRDIVVENARRRKMKRRVGDAVSLVTENLPIFEAPDDDVLALDAAMSKLESEDPDRYRLVALRYFAGLTVPEIAELLELSTSTVERRWRFLRAWLVREVEGQD